jgi:hypothetical protein
MEHNVRLTVFWKKVISVGTQNGWSEEAYKTVLNGLLLGSAFETFHAHRRRDLEFIIKQLYDRYHKNVTILDKESMLDNLTRDNGETMQSFCVRLMILIQETAALDPNNAAQRQDHILRTKINKNCSPEACVELTKIRNRHSQYGATISVEQIKHTVMDIETNANYVHRTHAPIFQTHSMEANMSATAPPMMRNFDRSRSRSRPREERHLSGRPNSQSPRRLDDSNSLRSHQRSQTPEKNYRREPTPSMGYDKSNTAQFVRDKTAEFRSRIADRGRPTNTPERQKQFHAPLVDNNEPMPEATPLYQNYQQNPAEQQKQQIPIWKHQEQIYPQPQSQSQPQTYTQPQLQSQQQFYSVPPPNLQQFSPHNQIIPQVNQLKNPYNQQIQTIQPFQTQAINPLQQYLLPTAGQQILQQQFKKNNNNNHQNQMRTFDKNQSQSQKQHSKILQQELLLAPGRPFYQSLMLNERCLLCNGGQPHVISECPRIGAASRPNYNYSGPNNTQTNWRQNNYQPERRQNNYRQDNNYRQNNYQTNWRQNNFDQNNSQTNWRQNNFDQNNNQTNWRQNSFDQNNRQRNDRPYYQHPYNNHYQNNQQQRQNYDQQNGRQYQNTNYGYQNYNRPRNNNYSPQRQNSLTQVTSTMENKDQKTQGSNSNSL